MKYGNLEKMMLVLEEREQHQQDQQLAKAKAEAKKVSDKIIAEGTARLEQRKARVRKEIEIREEQEKTRIKMRENQKVNLLKQDLIQRELDRCREYYSNLPTEQYLSFLDERLKATEQDSKVLKILVGVKSFEAVDKAFSDRYLVEADDKLQSGFVLSCENYNINHEVAELFQFRKQELSRTMMTYLFEDE